jgi:hypothetical protein
MQSAGFRAACDVIRRNKLPGALEEYKVAQKLIRRVTLTLKRVRCGVEIQNNLPEQCGIRAMGCCITYTF